MRALSFFIASLSVSAVFAEPYKVAPGPCSIESKTGEWIDQERNGRLVPWRFYLPGCAGSAPVIFVSHGLGGSRDGYQYLGEHLASHGYAAVHIQHTGSDLTAFQTLGRAKAIEISPTTAVAGGRYGDIAFAIRQIKVSNNAGPFGGRFDTSAMGITGHSYGARGSLISAGAVPSQNFEQSFAIPELRGAFALSPSPFGEDPATDFADMLMPIFHLTGSRDGSPVLALTPADRQIPFRVIENVDQYLLVLKDAVHATFSGRKIEADPMLDRHHEVVRMVSVAFWDEVLRDSDEARMWLRGEGLAGELHPEDVFSWKSALR